jgi:phospholipase D1/2
MKPFVPAPTETSSEQPIAPVAEDFDANRAMATVPDQEQSELIEPIGPTELTELTSAKRLLQPGHNCESIQLAHRFRFLIDGEAYFSVLRQALARAQRSIFIVGWDIDSRMHLVPGGADDGMAGPLAEFLHELALRRPRLHIYVLAWDFAMLYALEREWLPVYRMGWRTHRRIAFLQDGKHPVGASHHQKIVVIDDALAFTGGLDLTRSRWDTSAHAPGEALRHDANGAAYQPFHDIQVMFDGPAAHAVGQLVRNRWRRASGRRRGPRAFRKGPDNGATGASDSSPAPGAVTTLAAEISSIGGPGLRPPPIEPGSEHDPWPPGTSADIERIELGISLTMSPYDGVEAVQQIKQLYLDAVAAARENIYIENQYFTSGSVGEALQNRLADPDGPDILAVVPQRQSGWLQEATMGVMRARLYQRMVEADQHDRFSMMAPTHDKLQQGFINVHSKLLIVDDQWLSVGSANLNNRSMVLDSECNVTLEAAGDARVSALIAAIRRRLLAEHTGLSESTLNLAWQQRPRLNAVLGALLESGLPGPRRLTRLNPRVAPEQESLLLNAALIDPEQPVAAHQLIGEFVPEERRRPVTAKLLLLGAFALGVALLTVLWQFTPLARELSFSAIVRDVSAIGSSRFGPVLVLGAYVVASFISVPITLLIAASGFVFGAWVGGAYAMTGTLCAAAATYYAGAWLGRDAVRKLAGKRINKLSERVGQRGLVAVVILRILPVAPFTVVNLVAGASQIGIRDYMLGTVIGMGPGIAMTVTFAHQFVAAIAHPSLSSVLLLVGVGALLVGLSIGLQKMFAPKPDAG